MSSGVVSATPNTAFFNMNTPPERSASDEFIDAVRSFLDEATDCELEVLASRLQPYRIDIRSKKSATGATAYPILTLDNIQRL